MPNRTPGVRNLSLLGVALAIVLMGVVALLHRVKAPPALPSSNPPAPRTQPAALPASPLAAPAAPQDYVELIRQHHPAYPTTQPLARPLPLGFAGHFVVPEPVYLDGRQILWITRPDAAPAARLLPQAAQAATLLTRERPRFVHWMSDEKGDWAPPCLICLDARGEGFELVSAAGRQVIGQGRGYDWSRAFSWDEKIVVPTDLGFSVFALQFQGRGVPRIVEQVSPPLAQAGDGHAPVEIAFFNGPLAWIPPSAGHPGSAGAVKFVESAFFRLTPEQGWPSGLVHLVPLLDGTVLQLIAAAEGSVKLSVLSMEPMEAGEEKKIEALIFQLSDMDPNKRQEAYQRLTQYGRGLWPVAERMMDSADPETRSRLKSLLRAKSTPLLGGMELVGNKLRVIARHRDGGALFYAERGVAIERGQEEDQIIRPAWLSIRPGRPIELLHPDLVRDLEPDSCQLTPWFGEWILSDPVAGPRRFSGSGEAVRLLRQEELAFSEFLGIDQEGRYLFGKPARSATRPALAAGRGRDAEGSVGPTLLIDPRLPDPRPRLPVWPLSYPNGVVGWDKNDWPGAKQPGVWVLGTADWRALDEKEPFFITSDDAPPRPRFALARPAASAPASRPALGPEEQPLLLDEQGNYYFDGRNRLTVVHRDGSMRHWDLPAIAQGDERSEVHLVKSPQGRLFLFNRPGRVLRLRPAFEEPEPFVIEATFTRQIPNSAHLTRVWLDPFGRICIAYEGTKLALLFPQGYIPPETAQLLTAEQLKEAME